MVTIKKFTFNPFQENTYVLYDETKVCVIIDPGCYDESEEQVLVQFIESNNLKPLKVISTHSHIDHVLGNAFVCDYFKIPLQINKEDQQTLDIFPATASMYGFPSFKASPKPSSFLNLEEGVTFGNSKLDVLFVPGHAPGHVVFVSREANFVINGDCLFHGSIGRTDLPGGNHEKLIKNIKEKLFTLPNDMTVYCGHGPETTIGFEKENNPFLS